ncbi:vacuolar fusion protein CCZ1 homolog B isoform X2 [Hevea brasiliensis]|uniref:vacuolar fusion protein CCZ1 homolog B isoform X2 n=1 Tax=Hevea brasiliensis TaxID=3981 RepID=UPI0025DF2AE4|nr:vacuolar fusion protein CCZ1 homolog B isoform X2 [Hevea brasiliensis]
MGLASVNTVIEDMQICIFDLRRGQEEGRELDKILFFFPADSPSSKKLSVIGLGEGLIAFTRIFSPEAACEVIEAERHSHVFYEAEPDIWMVMMIEKSVESEATWRIDALREILQEVHSLFMMFHGSIRAMLENEPTGGLVRSHLYPFIMDYLSDFLVGKKLHLPSFRDCLTRRRTVQMLTVGREAAIEVQLLVRILESCAGTTPCHSLILFQDLLVSTTISADDTINLFAYSVLRLTPRALSSGVSSWSYLLKGNTVSHIAAASTLAHYGSASEHLFHSHGNSPGQDSSYNVKRPLWHDKWSKGKDGFLVTDVWGREMDSMISATPTIWLQETEEKASLKILKVEEKLSKGWGGENAYHVKGYRYLLVDDDRNTSRASPPVKASTLTKESLLAMSKLREEVDLEKRRGKLDSTDHKKNLEICIRAKNNAWVIAHTMRGKELYMVLEKANETLLYASDAVEKFSNGYCGGTFSLD